MDSGHSITSALLCQRKRLTSTATVSQRPWEGSFHAEVPSQGKLKGHLRKPVPGRRAPWGGRRSPKLAASRGWH